MDPTRPKPNKNLDDFDLSQQDTKPSDHPPQPMQSPFPALPQLVTKTSQRNINLGGFDQSPQDTRPFDHPQQTMQSPLSSMPQLVTRSSQTTNRRSRNLQGSSSAALHHASNADPIATPSQKFKGAQDNELAKIVAGDAANFKTTLLRSHKQFPDFASVIEKKTNIDQQPSSPEISATDIGNHSEPMLTEITAQPEWSRKLSVICEENDICGLEDLLSDESTSKQEKINAIRVELGKNQFLESEFASELARFVRIRADPETRVSTHLTTDLCQACNSRNNEDVNAVLSDDQISPDDMRYGIWLAMREGFNDEILGSFLLYAQKHGFAKDFIELANNHGKDIDDLNPTPATNVVAISPNQHHVLQVVQNAIDWVKAKLPHAINQRQGVLDSNGEAELRGLFYQLRARGKHDVSREEIRDCAIISVEAGGGSCRSYAATLLVKLSAATDLPLTLAEVLDPSGNQHQCVIVGNQRSDFAVVADAWTLNGRACLLKHLPAYFRSGTPIYTHTPEEVDPIADLDEVRTADLKEVMKTLSAENSIKDWLIEPGPNLLSKIKEFNSSKPYLYDCHTFVKNRSLSYMNTADGEIFDPVGKSLSSTNATYLRLVNAFRRI